MKSFVAGAALAAGMTLVRVPAPAAAQIAPDADRIVTTGAGLFGDAGRVHVDGASPGGWHTSAGGGVYFQPVRQPYLLRLGAGSSIETTKLFLSLGLPY